ncbi:GPI anchored cell wall protein [Paecilomyces variotii No. 5]|uniref:GPI anchored cell wall protein n=1 Tax=Byssochlamys spectabilis (strain No. 5 / NBRC 109023) TaxID=1356009 RepID=V5FAW2_BYSSN|nr:GPI anchored cell wall protein [Paecilomyces variotii No. 5]
MRFGSYILSSAAIAATVSAQSTTVVSVFAAGPTRLPLAGIKGSIVDANAVATTMVLNCVDAPSVTCALHQPLTVTEGPSTWSMSAVISTETRGVEATLTLDQKCKITSSTQLASCSESVGLQLSTEGFSTSTGTTTVTSYSSDSIYYPTMTVTGGIEQLNQPQATQTPDAAAGRIGMGGAAAAAVAAAAAGFL